MKYRNTITGAIFESNGICAGDKWEIIPEAPAQTEPKPAPQKPTTAKGKKK